VQSRRSSDEAVIAFDTEQKVKQLEQAARASGAAKGAGSDFSFDTTAAFS
jgi:hypothetical protein